MTRAVFDIRPGSGIGPISIGMTREEALAAVADAGLAVQDFRRAVRSGPPDLYISDQLFAYFEEGDRVEEVEVSVCGAHPVLCLDMDLTASFAEILARMKTVARVDETDPDPSVRVYPEIGLAFWSESGPDEEAPVQAISVCRPESYPFD